MESVDGLVGSAVIAIGAGVGLPLNMLGSSESARVFSESVVNPAMESLAPDFHF